MAVSQLLDDHDATGLAALVRAKDVSPLELVEAAISRIEALNPKLNAVITPIYGLGREAAQNVQGPFAGVPFLLKDIRAAYAGVPRSAGSKALKTSIPDFDSELVKRYKRAGLVTLGKTNTPELGQTATTEPHAFGATHNPWGLGRTPGGSSGGSAAAVAARIVPAAHSTDGGGSIRIPASCCGLVGLKPTRGRNPMGPESGDVLGGLICEHVVSRTVRDSAALLDATAGPDIGDPYPAPPIERPFAEEVGRDPGKLRIAFSTAAPTGNPVDPDCAAAVQRVAALLEDLGHRVEEAAPAYDDEAFRKAFRTIWFSGLAATIGSHPKITGHEIDETDYEPMTWLTYERAREVTAARYLHAVSGIQGIARQVAAFFETYDVFLTPTLATPPAELGYLHPGPGETEFKPYPKRVGAFCPFTQMANATGQPAVSLPLEMNQAGLPIGTHFTARFGAEATLFRLAGQLEQARPWIDRKPAIAR